jgi:hypothetical protein
VSGELDHGLDAEVLAQVLREAEGLRDPGADPDLEAVRTAILLEDALGIVLTDDDITPDLLGDPASVADLVARQGHV